MKKLFLTFFLFSSIFILSGCSLLQQLPASSSGVIISSADLDKIYLSLDDISKRVDDLSSRVDQLYMIKKESEKVPVEKTMNANELAARMNILDTQLKELKTKVDSFTIQTWQIQELYSDLSNLKHHIDTMQSPSATLNEQAVRNIIQTELDKSDLSKKYNDTIDKKVELAVLKYVNKPQNNQNVDYFAMEKSIKLLQIKMDTLDKQLNIAVSRPDDTIEEKLESKISDLETRLNSILKDNTSAQTQKLFDGDKIYHVVRQGDTLSGISGLYNLGLNGSALITSTNNLKSSNLYSGQKLLIPVNNISGLLKWPLQMSKQTDYNSIIIKFGQKTMIGVSSGIGISLKTDDFVFPVLSGKVVETGKTINDKFYIKIDHGSSLVSIYSNLDTINAKESDWINLNTMIGTISKNSTFNFEIWKDGEPKDPFRFFFSSSGTFAATFYTEWDGMNVYIPYFRSTRSGKIPRNWHTLSADPTVLPLGTIVYVPELADKPNGGFFVIEDTGGAIKGKRIDIYINDIRQAFNRMDISIYIVGKI